MGDSSESPVLEYTSPSLTETFENAFPYYLSIGMSYDEYWERDPYLVTSFIKAHELSIEQRNQEMYMQGIYNYKAFKAVIDAFSYGLGGSKGRKPDGYLERPIAITDHEKEEERRISIERTLKWVEAGQK